ncbi:neuroglobin-like [Pocillopora damicornis]|uniref:neuroglobin-like n=1 Tax=Pocillopora damicornis TaxID=46731 RepID=UPI000F55768C|nr:neuroglobin-like [Pocillopora damicornis]
MNSIPDLYQTIARLHLGKARKQSVSFTLREQKITREAMDSATGSNLTPSSKALSEDDKVLVRDTWREATKPEREAGQKLFKRIFQIAPEAQDYFSSSDLESDEFQGHITSVISTLDKALQNLDDLTPLLPTLERLGTIHANMGIKRQQLNVVKQALLFTLSQELRELFTDECRKAWELTFDILADAMATGMVANSNDD